jgi:hypothetical protein
MDIYLSIYKLVEVQFQAAERILKLGREPSHPETVLKALREKTVLGNIYDPERTLASRMFLCPC